MNSNLELRIIRRKVRNDLGFLGPAAILPGEPTAGPDEHPAPGGDAQVLST